MLSAHDHVKRSPGSASDIQQSQSGPGSIIRLATRDDFNIIMKIENTCFPGDLAYSRQQMRHLLYKANSATLVEVSGETITGYVTALFRNRSNVAGVETIGVSPDARGQGVGKRLLSAAEQHMVKKGVSMSRLEVSSGNKNAISMYTKAGYDISRVNPEFYIHEHHGTREAYTMHKKLETASP
ncbi:MAG: GNAT family N-acetyltransferase [Thermoplasmata archaeon]|nr:GNAT family N-acetyltransferase [Thermoplasmata archaeon]